MIPTFFPKPSDFRKWLDKNHKTETELVVGFYKIGSNKPSINWPQSVDEALCYGWIDGVRKSIDEESYSVRFTQRKPTSIWSAINIKKVEVLTQQGLMKPAGLASFAKRTEKNSKIYAYEQEPVELSATFEKQFKANKKAWDFFKTQAPSYQRTAIHGIMTAKQETTRLNRLNQLIQDSEVGQRLGHLKWTKK